MKEFALFNDLILFGEEGVHKLSLLPSKIGN